MGGNVVGFLAVVTGLILGGATAFGVVQSQSAPADSEANAPVVVSYGNN